MNLSEAVRCVGKLTIELVYPDGRRITYFERDNLIVKSAKQFMLTQVYAPGVMSDPITALKAGTAGNIDPQGLYPKVEDPLQTDLITPVITVPTVNVPDLPNVQVTFLADVTQTQCNGLQLTECGLFKAGGGMFNVKNHPGINKTADFSVHYSWTIKYL